MSSNPPPQEPAPSSLAALSLSIFSDLLSNLTHDLVLQSHRAEKLLRTQQQQHAAHLAAAAAATNTNSVAAPPDVSSAPKIPPGNPLATVPTEVLCTRCHLPRHTPETLTQVPILLENGDKKKFCTKLPFQNKGGHDIYGTPFPNQGGAAPKKGKKEKAAAMAAAAAGAESGDSPGGTSTPAANGDELSAKPGKNSGIVYFKCTSCDNSKVASRRFAAHLEKCLGLSGRKSSRAAMAKMNGSNTGSPALAPVDGGGSRKPSPEKNGKVGTPVPGPVENGDSGGSKGSLTSIPVPAAPPVVAMTPKKKKKVPVPTSAPTEDLVKSDLPPLPLPPSIKDTSTPSTSVPSSLPAKKRKRKLDTDGEVPKKPKLVPNPTSKLKAPVPTPPGKPENSIAPAISTLPPPPDSLPKKPPKPKFSKPKLPAGGGGGGVGATLKKTLPAVNGAGAEANPKKVVKKKLAAVPGKTLPGAPRGVTTVAGKTPPVVAGKRVPGREGN